MANVESLHKAFAYLRDKGQVHTQLDLAKKMQASRSNISSAFNGDTKCLTDNFLKRFNAAFGNPFDLNWLMTGEGEMLRGNFLIEGDGNIQVGGNAHNVNAGKTIDELVSLLKKRDEQIDRLITLLENKQ